MHTEEQLERIAEAMSGRTMYPGREPLRDERLLREAMFLQVWSAPTTTQTETLRRLFRDGE